MKSGGGVGGGGVYKLRERGIVPSLLLQPQTREQYSNQVYYEQGKLLKLKKIYTTSCKRCGRWKHYWGAILVSLSDAPYAVGEEAKFQMFLQK